MFDFISKKEKSLLLLIVFLAFIISLSHSFYFKITPSVDARAYDRIAFNLINGKGYVENPDIPFENDFSIARVGPGYEIFLAGVYYIFGRHWGIIWILQAIFHAFSALAAFLISKKIFGGVQRPIIGLSAAALVAFSPDLIVSSSMLLTETFGIFLTSISVYFFFGYLDIFSKRKLSLPFFLASIFLGLAILVRSNLALLAAVYIGVFIYKRLYFESLFFVLLVSLMFSPWIIRNYEAYGIFFPFNAASGFNLWTGNHLGASGELDFYKPLYNFANSHTPIETHKFGVNRFKEFISDHPLEFVKITLNRVSIYFSFLRPTGFWSYLSNIPKIITITLSLIYGITIFSLGFSGLYLGLKDSKNKDNIKWLAFMVFIMPLALIAIMVETRYRYPIYPFLAIFSGFAVYKFTEDKKKSIMIFIPVFFIFFANALFDFLKNSGRAFEIIDKLLN